MDLGDCLAVEGQSMDRARREPGQCQVEIEALNPESGQFHADVDCRNLRAKVFFHRRRKRIGPLAARHAEDRGEQPAIQKPLPSRA